MRSGDRALPSIGGDRPTTERWPVSLFIGLERQPIPSYTYDDYTARYDDPQRSFVYDWAGAWPYDRLDLFCRFHGLTITSGSTAPSGGRFDAAELAMTLDNRDGSLSQYDTAGRLVDWPPGSALDIWAELDGVAFWLFSGEVTAWRERADGTIDAEAFDAFSRLNDEIPAWKPGAYGQTPQARLNAVLNQNGYTGRRRLDLGTVTLHSYQTSHTPLEEAQAVAASDGGVVFTDADGTLVYTDRAWMTGRDDQPRPIPVFADNVCDGAMPTWDAALTSDDDVITNKATLTNVAGVTVTAANTDSVNRYGPQSLARQGDQWINTPDGQALADHLVTLGGQSYLRLESFALYLHDVRHPELWRAGIDRRLGDLVTWMHQQPTTTGPTLVSLQLAVRQVTHEITPESWVTTIGTTRTVGNVVALRYDRTSFRYDQADPRVVYAL